MRSDKGVKREKRKRKEIREKIEWSEGKDNIEEREMWERHKERVDKLFKSETRQEKEAIVQRERQRVEYTRERRERQK